jgi:DNA-binding transcriptional LysR family regulator
MNRTQINFQLLAVFVAVVENKSFSRAAQQLGVGKGTVSRSIARLEQHLGVELLHRTTHHVALSTAGAALYERTGPHVSALHEAVLDLPELDDEPSGLLRITAPRDLGTLVLPAALTSFAQRFPGVQFDVRLTEERLDLVKEGYDLAIRATARPLKDSTLKVRRVGRSSLSFYASPSYVARRGRPRLLGDPQHTWIIHANTLHLMSPPPETTRFVVDDFFLARALAQDGAGVGLLPEFVAQPSVRDGLLEEQPLAQRPQMDVQFMLLYPSSGQTPRKVTAFSDHLAHVLTGGLQPPP